MCEGIDMTDPKDTTTTQTMRAHLRQHGLPEAWAEWVKEIAIEAERPERIRANVYRPEPPEREFTDYDDEGTPIDAEHTDDEMAELWADYAVAMRQWREKYGNAEMASVTVESGGQTLYKLRVSGLDDRGKVVWVTLTSNRNDGPWSASGWLGRGDWWTEQGLTVGGLVAKQEPPPPGAVYSWDEAVEKKPKLSADDITAALWDMPGKERAVVLYPFWPAISEAAQRTHHAEEKATAAIADAAHYRCLLNDCRRVLTTAEDDRDAARKERDEARLDAGRLRNELSRARQQVGARENESIAEALQSIVVALEHERNGALTQRDDALRKLAEATPLPTGTSGMVQGADGREYPKPSPLTERAEKLRELCLEMASYLAERAGRGE